MKLFCASLVIGLLLFVQAGSALPQVTCLTAEQENILLAQANSSAYLAIFQKVCEAQDLNQSNYYTKGETDIYFQMAQANIQSSTDSRLNATILAMNNTINGIEAKLTGKLDKSLNDSISSLRKDLDVLKAVESLQDITRAAADITALKVQIQSFDERLTRAEKITDDTRSQLQQLSTLGNLTKADIGLVASVQQLQIAYNDSGWVYYLIAGMAVLGIIGFIFRGQIEETLHFRQQPERRFEPKEEHISHHDIGKTLDSYKLINVAAVAAAAKKKSEGYKALKETARKIREKIKEDKK